MQFTVQHFGQIFGVIAFWSVMIGLWVLARLLRGSSANDTLDIVKLHFDKLLLAFTFYILMFMALHMVHHQVDAASQSWIENIVSQVLAALLTLMVGNRNQPSSNGNGNPTPKPDTKTITKSEERP